MVLHRQSSAWPQPQSSSRLGAYFRSGLTQAVLRRLIGTPIQQGPLLHGRYPASSLLQPPPTPNRGQRRLCIPATSCHGPTPVGRTLGWVSQVPRSICRHPPSSTTPGSPAAARARCFAAGSRLRPFTKVGHSQLLGFNEAESGSLALRLTSLHSQASTGWSPITPLGSFMANEQLPWSVPFT